MNSKILIFIVLLGFTANLKAQVLDAPMKIINHSWEENESGDGIVSNREPIPYSHIRKADVTQAKTIWRQIDLREKMNLPLYYPENTDDPERISLMQLLWKSVTTEGIVRGFADEYFKEQKTTQQIIEETTSKEIVTVPSRLDPDQDSTYESINEFQTKDVKKFLIREEWFFDKEESAMMVRVRAICPLKDRYTVNQETGDKEFLGLVPLFWVYFDEARKPFAKNEVYNRQNSAEKRSFDDLFHKRFFSSYITKKESEYNREIQDYETGINALLEAEKIKENIFNDEQDLWQY